MGQAQGNVERGICSLPYERQSDGEIIYFPSNLIENLYGSNGFVYADGYQQLAGIRNIELGLGNTFVTATIPNNIYSSFGASWYITGGIQANMLPISTPSNITAVTCTDPIILQSGSSVKDYCFIGDAVGNVSDLLAYDNSSTNRPHTPT